MEDQKKQNKVVSLDKFRLKVQCPTEAQEQKALVEWLHHKKIVFYHIPNGMFSSPREGHKFKLLGLKSGVPDLCVPYPIASYHGLYIELKRRSGGVVSVNQRDWLNFLTDKGYKAVIANGYDEAVKIIEEYFNVKA